LALTNIANPEPETYILMLVGLHQRRVLNVKVGFRGVSSVIAAPAFSLLEPFAVKVQFACWHLQTKTPSDS
jgi:hypothetical protein